MAARERMSASAPAPYAPPPTSSSSSSSAAKMNIDSIIEEENAEKERLERAKEEAAEKVS